MVSGWSKARRARRLRCPVISVGSLSAGGAGKTPVVLALARLLTGGGVRVDVLSRGYGRGSGIVERVTDGGSAVRFGDEPVEMARAGVEVWVGADRYLAGLESEAGEFRGVHLLDDGFQHRRLGRELDVVLLTLEDVRDWLLPAGNLREGLGALGRADVVVVREDEAAGLVRWTAGKEVWVVRRQLQVPGGMGKVVVFCGIARPEGFLAMVREAAVQVVGSVVFADHFAYGIEDARRLAALREHAGADGFLCTAKDFVKLDPEMVGEMGTVWVGELRVEFVGEDGAWERVRKVLQ